MSVTITKVSALNSLFCPTSSHIIRYIKFERKAANTHVLETGVFELINQLLEQQLTVIFCQSNQIIVSVPHKSSFLTLEIAH